ncbi:GDP-mannose-dependent monoacylated alpha-(1-6)-phosphatidylinositol monomannoside mannosyltransferase [Vibrio chagasii]|nr:GDP-mannose-dependent monoacylated alpha-(1-6)-phosphatidylinositol monomannoside mannosyltransferase [Vibrio chagasii]CAH7176823.1 GDP-mannose-dependent monoacylated alpha-(1-6)-phosphatidylinositol monomannoside mannosyltransferase [Vibrio chagasii]CAH7244021.1 GDP-mannose-dependent monoacylated alpha-(1-6)-phosphatidylinositol monomannoside mannosyltransferase [Vibrio chagasii]CAH7376737.1 GDP-mannose-dependent monoacylated alpha-(1-6)-phosphatidylinositol monomannoside mannosyltransferase
MENASKRNLKILVVGHHFVVKDYQKLWEECNKIDSNISYELIMPKCSLQNGNLVHVHEDLNSPLKIHTVEAPFAKQGRQHLLFFKDIEEKIRKINPDFIYCAEEANSIITMQIGRICKKIGIDYSFWSSLNFNRDYWSMYSYFNIRKYLFTLCNRYNFKHSSFANVTSTAAYDTKVAQGYTKPMIVAQTHAVSQEFFDVGNKRIDKNTDTSVKKTIGFVGRLLDWKGIDILIEALASMDSGTYDLVIYGDGEEKENIRNLSKKLNVKIIFKEFVCYEEMPNVFSNIDILVLPSLTRNGINEKFGRVLIEGMAAGCVAVGSADGGIPKVLSSAGVLFKPGDSKNLTQVLESLLFDNSYFRLMQENCYNDTLEKHAYSSIASNLHSEIKELLCW